MAHDHEHNTLCHCGTIDEAVEAARKLYIQLAGTDCPVWALGVATALRAMAVESLVDEEVTRPMLKTICDGISHQAKKINFEQLDHETVIHRTKLRGGH